MAAPPSSRSIPARLALGLGLIDKEQYRTAMSVWEEHSDLDIGVILLEQGAIKRDHLEMLRQLVGTAKGIPDREQIRHAMGMARAAPPPAATPTPSPEPLAKLNPWLPGALVLGRYEVQRSLGRGSMGEVLMAFDRFLNRRVAIKAPHPRLARNPTAVEALRSEVALAHAVNHPNIARTFDLGEVGGLPFVSMEFIEGSTLQAELDRCGGSFDEARVRKLAAHLCAALGAAHANGVVHRDLKPANVMLTKAPRHVVVMDFGIAAATEEPGATLTPGTTSSGGWSKTTLAGTPAYMAPEQWNGGACDPRTDIYQLGVLLYRVLSGRLPFDGTAVELRQLHEKGTPQALRTLAPKVSPAMAALVERAMAKSPAQRPASMREVARALVPFPWLALAWRIGASILACAVVLFAFAWTLLGLTRVAVLSGLRPATARLAELAARGIDPADLRAARTADDIAKPEFKRIHDYLSTIKRDNPELLFAYTLRRLGEQHWEFAVDADPTDEDKNGDGEISDDEEGSPPGRKYDGTAFPAMDRAVTTGKAQADDDFAYDDWGFLLSGYAPITDPQTGERYIIGVDVGNGPIERFTAGMAALFLVLWVLGSALAVRYWWLRLGGAGTRAGSSLDDGGTTA